MGQKTKRLVIFIYLFFSVILISNKVFSFNWPRWVCVDPGHGGKWTGTMGWNNKGPAEKVQNLKACQVLDRVLFQSYDGEYPFYNYNYAGVIHTRIDDSELDESLGTDLHLRAEIANGNESGYYNQNYDFRTDFPPAYGYPWWTEITQKLISF